MLSQIRRLNTLLFNIRKNLPSVHTENNSASVIGHTGCRRHIYDWSAEAGFSIFSLCLEAGLRPSAGRQLLLLAAAARWRCCHGHDGGVLLLIRRSASVFIVVFSKNFVTQVRVPTLGNHIAGQKCGASCNKITVNHTRYCSKASSFSANIRSDYGT
jgi:hypothetical protein